MTSFHFACALLLMVMLKSANSNVAINENSDEALTSYLQNVMQKYTVWLKDNNFDPSPPVEETLVVNSPDWTQHILNCELRNQRISRHSSNQAEMYNPASYLGGNGGFEVRRIHNEPYTFTGDFSCTGKIKSEPEIPFSGQGNYEVTSSRAEEFAKFTNVRITEGSKLDLEVVQIEYHLHPSFDGGSLEGQWNETVVAEKYLQVLANDFRTGYNQYLSSPVQHGGCDLHPSFPLYTGYILNITEGLDLNNTDIHPPPTDSPVTDTPTTNLAKMNIAVSFTVMLFFAICSYVI